MTNTMRMRDGVDFVWRCNVWIKVYDTADQIWSQNAGVHFLKKNKTDIIENKFGLYQKLIYLCVTNKK